MEIIICSIITAVIVIGMIAGFFGLIWLLMEILTMPIIWWYDRKEKQLGCGDGDGSGQDLNDPSNPLSPSFPSNISHTINF